MKRITALLLCLTVLLSFALPCVSAASCEVTLSKTSYVYDGNAKKPSVTVKYGSKTLKNKTDYTVSYPSGRANVGKYKVSVTLKGKYSGQKTAYFKIMPTPTNLSSVKGDSGSVSVTWAKRTAQISGYKIEYSTSPSFENAKYVKVKSNTVTEKKITGLASGAKYYVRIRTYKDLSNTTYYSSWSDTLSVKTAKASGGSSAVQTDTGIYITPTGRCYHYSRSCAGKNASPTPADYAKRYYRPCSKCT